MKKHCFPFFLFLVKSSIANAKQIPKMLSYGKPVIFVHPKLKSSFLCAFLFRGRSLLQALKEPVLYRLRTIYSDSAPLCGASDSRRSPRVLCRGLGRGRIA